MSNVRALVETPKYLRITIPRDVAGKDIPMITCFLFSQGRIIAATDTASIFVYHADTGSLSHRLDGHSGGVWALKLVGDLLVSGSTDKTIRIWDLHSGECTHTFTGHQHTVRCLEIITPSSNNYRDPESNVERTEEWPFRPYLVSGSRDYSLRLWVLPLLKDESKPKYCKFTMTGHKDGVRDVAARGRVVASASSDSTVRIWDVVKGGSCTWVLAGHTDRVRCVAIDPTRPQVYSGSADMTVRVWNYFTGNCLYTLDGHSGTVGTLSASPSYLVSAAADETVCIWGLKNGVMRYSSSAAGTTAYNDEFALFSGSAITGELQLWSMSDGTLLRTLQGPSNGCQSTLFEGQYCICSGADETSGVLDVWKFAAFDEMDVDQTS